MSREDSRLFTFFISFNFFGRNGCIFYLIPTEKKVASICKNITCSAGFFLSTEKNYKEELFRYLKIKELILMYSPILKQIGTIFIPVSNIEKARDWYCDILGVK